MPRLLCAALIVAISIPVAASQQQPTFRGGGDTVRVFVTVTDGERLVPGLTEKHFEASRSRSRFSTTRRSRFSW